MCGIYVGTYAKYTAGSIAGEWIDPENFEGMENFLAACKELHKDESDPELMYQDWEGIPEGMVTEHFIDPELWEFLKLEEWKQEAVRIYRREVSPSGSIADILEAYRGKFDSVEDWASESLIASGIFEGMPDVFERYFDWESYARDEAMGVRVAENEGFVYIFN